MKSTLRRIIKKIGKGINIQDCQCNIMINIVQDMLDLGQIKAKKFQKNVGSFDIRDVVENVIKMQNHEAALKGIKITATFVNISKCANIMDRRYSPIIITD